MADFISDYRENSDLRPDVSKNISTGTFFYTLSAVYIY